MIEFNRQLLTTAITELPPSRRVAVCGASSERLIPFYEAYWATRATGPSLLRTGLDLLWNQLLGSKFELSSSQIEELWRVAQTSVPDEDDLFAEHLYAQDAAIAVIYALKAWQTCDPCSAALCLEQVYNVVDNYVLRETAPPGAITEEMEAQVLQHPIVQAELLRQAREIELCRTTEDNCWLAVVSQMRSEAIGTRLFPSTQSH